MSIFISHFLAPTVSQNQKGNGQGVFSPCPDLEITWRPVRKVTRAPWLRGENAFSLGFPVALASSVTSNGELGTQNSSNSLGSCPRGTGQLGNPSQVHCREGAPKQEPWARILIQTATILCETIVPLGLSFPIRKAGVPVLHS